MADPNYENLFYNAYTAARMQVPQERMNPFNGTVTMDVLMGENKSYDDIGVGTMKKKTTRFADVVHTDNEMRRRWLFPEYYYDAKLTDKQDNIALLGDPTGDFITSMTYAIERQKRDVVINAFDAAVSGGKNPGDTSYTFTATSIDNTAGRVIPVDADADGDEGGTSAGLTIEKLMLIQEKFAALGIPDGVPIWMVASQRQRTDLLKEAETQSIDTSEIRALVDGRINRYMGINFVFTNAITLGSANGIGGGNVYECFAWIPEGIVLATNPAPTFRVDYLPTKVGDTWQIRTDFGCNAIRRHEDMVLKVECE